MAACPMDESEDDLDEFRASRLCAPRPAPRRPTTQAIVTADFQTRYLLKAEIGQGTFACVYAGIDTVLCDLVVFKMCRETFCINPMAVQQSLSGIPGDIATEYTCLSRLRHAHIVELRDLVLCPALDVATSRKAEGRVITGIKQLPLSPAAAAAPASVTDAARLAKYQCILVLEHLDGGNLQQFLYNASDGAGISARPRLIAQWMYQLLSAVAYCHEQGIVHRDIASKNVLVDKTRMCVKLADFGCAEVVPSVTKAAKVAKVTTKTNAPAAHKHEEKRRPSALAPGATTMASVSRTLLDVQGTMVTPWYRAPELMLGSQNYTAAIDIWALGCIFGEMFLGRPLILCQSSTDIDQLLSMFRLLGLPNRQRDPVTVRYPHFAGKVFPQWHENRLRDLLPESVLCAAGLDLLNKMLCYDFDARITAAEALAHPYFDSVRRTLPSNP